MESEKMITISEAELRKIIVEVSAKTAQTAATEAVAFTLEQFANSIEQSTISVSGTSPNASAHVSTAQFVAQQFSKAARDEAVRIRKVGVPIIAENLIAEL